MITALLGWLSSGVFGSIIGGAFGLANRWLDAKSKAIDMAFEEKKLKHELDKLDKDLEIVKAEAAGKKEVSIIEGDSLIESARFAAVGESHRADSLSPDLLKAAGGLSWVFVLVEAFRKFIRPGLTVLLCGASLVMSYYVLQEWLKLSSLVSVGEKSKIALLLVEWLIAQTSMILSYWFVGRGNVKT
jgi:hypothetical protein